eukprot:CAMPEP_0174383122 /NCGR_PEP_ID=MMETSP0811_2-20130205/125017_1 /TAXON_ID=73025 ORGANISM="Eutreptiella gymnastica-like, Strain CCMP1594" /NCGR_SAMPLE_ID=MMETSP0811_2 /ASSEMBLY_ACC=CAM_ASM_000667 /LENGTH=494 /DNA_ID=CAMNT_0015536591 /DNA_START=39 /DNA_END=1523 /DNA_ORIENTATION=+
MPFREAWGHPAHSAKTTNGAGEWDNARRSTIVVLDCVGGLLLCVAGFGALMSAHRNSPSLSLSAVVAPSHTSRSVSPQARGGPHMRRMSTHVEGADRVRLDGVTSPSDSQKENGLRIFPRAASNEFSWAPRSGGAMMGIFSYVVFCWTCLRFGIACFFGSEEGSNMDAGRTCVMASVAEDPRDAEDGKGGEEDPPTATPGLDWAKGLVGNGIGLSLLFGLAAVLGLEKYALLALAVQWATWLCHGLPYKSEKFYDLSGSLTHLLVNGLALLHGAGHPRQIVNGLLVAVWCTRLGAFLFARITKDGRDERFDSLKANPAKWLAVWTLQALWVFIILLPVLVCNDQTVAAAMPGIGLRDGVGWALWLLGFAVEVAADAQKRAFRATAGRGKFIKSGLWAYSRHPNYFGEILLWSAMVITCSSNFTQAQQWLTLLSPAFTAFLLLYVSGVPMLEEAGEKKWGHLPEYQHYMRQTSCIIPWKPAPPFDGDPAAGQSND